MPIYEYRCEACNHELEAIQKISEPPLQDCPKCGAASLTKLVSAAGFRLKGGGWYETDFKTGKDKKKNLAGDSSDSKSAAKSESKAETPKESPKSESKPAATPST